MQHTVYLLTTDTECGNTIQAFASEAELVAAQTKLMHERYRRVVPESRRPAFLALIASDFHAAWDEFCELDSYDNNYYCVDESTLTLPDPAPPTARIVVDVSGGVVQGVVNLPPHILVEVRDWDGDLDPTCGGTATPDPDHWYQHPETGDWASLSVWY